MEVFEEPIVQRALCFERLGAVGWQGEEWVRCSEDGAGGGGHSRGIPSAMLIRGREEGVQKEGIDTDIIVSGETRRDCDTMR